MKNICAYVCLLFGQDIKKHIYVPMLVYCLVKISRNICAYVCYEETAEAAELSVCSIVIVPLLIGTELLSDFAKKPWDNSALVGDARCV